MPFSQCLLKDTCQRDRIFLTNAYGPGIQYARAKTSEAKRNLFAVLFDHVLHDFENKVRGSQKQLPSTEEIQAVATALCLAEASECFAFAFRQGLSGVGEALAKSIVTAMARDVTSGRLNSEVSFAVIFVRD